MHTENTLHDKANHGGSFISVSLLSQSCADKNAQQNETQTTTTGIASEGDGQSVVKDDVSQKTGVGVAMGSKDHTTLVKAIKQAKLVNALSNAGPFTVFAPTDVAFAQLPAGTLDDLMKPENKKKLLDIL
jgi:uncharacterized surface protein with fasciclin (FAS1) repeats